MSELKRWAKKDDRADHMNADRYATLRAGVNYILEGRQCSPHGTRISTEHLLIYGRYDLATIEEAIARWESAGMVRVLKPFQSCSPRDDCIEATQFIEEKSPIKGWLNWQEPDEESVKKEEPNQSPEPSRL